MNNASLAVIKDCKLSLPTFSSFHHRTHPSPLSSSSSSSSLIVSNFKLGSPLQRLLLQPKYSISFHVSAKPRPIPPLSASYGDKAPRAESPAKALRRILDSPGVHKGPACFDALSAKLVERAGFEYCFTSGMCAVFGGCFGGFIIWVLSDWVVFVILRYGYCLIGSYVRAFYLL